MKKLSLSVALLTAALVGTLTASAQVNILTSVVGAYIGGSFSTGDGVSATSALLPGTTGVAVDASGNVYVGDYGYHKVRMVRSSSALIYTAAGNGTAGFGGDGGPATAANLASPQSICIDAARNLYIVDAGNQRVRKVTAATGIINTVAGGGTGYTEGALATSVDIGDARCIALNNTGVLHIVDATGVLRRVDPITNNITTVPGVMGATTVAFDAANNIYYSGVGTGIRKIDAITSAVTVLLPAGGDRFCLDPSGNIYFGDGSKIYELHSGSSYVDTIAGCGTSYDEGVPAREAYGSNYMFTSDRSGNIYYSNNSTNVRKINTSVTFFSYFGTPSFSVVINKLCNGPQITVMANHYSAGMTVQTFFGDGQNNITTFSAGCATTNGYAVINHTYPFSGTYTIKMVMYMGGVAIDSVHSTYEYVFCNTIPVKFFFDGNNSCTKDFGEPYINLPILTKVDSNGVTVDTISATNGMYYNAYGHLGDIYKFTPLALPSGLALNCPGSGYILDTLTTLVYNNDYREFGFKCSGTSGYDLQIFSTARAGRHSFNSDMVVDNQICAALPATVVFNMNPKYHYQSARPAPTSVVGNTITWDLTLSSTAPNPTHINVSGEVPSTWTHVGDTIQTSGAVMPFSGDAFPGDNNCGNNDTVTGSWDPNYMQVLPRVCVAPGVKTLRYTVHFENTGNDTAYNIHVMDTLSANIDPKTVRVVTASHAMDISLINTGGYNIVRFNFPNINLLDSSHHNLCDGFFMYTADLKSGLTDGTHISNRAGIYFDDNAVVMTNGVENITGCIEDNGVPVLVNSNKAEIYPNPASDELTIMTETGAYTSYSITNSMGQMMNHQSITSTYTKVDIKALPAGLYYVTLRGESGNMIRKVVKK